MYVSISERWKQHFVDFSFFYPEFICLAPTLFTPSFANGLDFGLFHYVLWNQTPSINFTEGLMH